MKNATGSISIFALLIFLGGLIYIPSLGNQFLWDDVKIIQDNPFIGSEYRPRIKDFFSDNYFRISRETTYRPVPTTLYYFAGIISGKNPEGYRVANMALNILAGILVMILGTKFFGHIAGLFAGLLFTMHPIHSETIFIASFNEDILMALFLMAAFLLYISYRKSGNKLILVLSAISLLFSCLSKETGVVFLAIVVFYQEFMELTGAKGNKWLAYGTYFFTALLYLCFRFVLFPGVIYPESETAGYFGGNIIKNMIIVIPLIAEYVHLAVFPFNLQTERLPGFSYFGLVAGIVLLGWILFVIFRFRKKFGLWFVFFLAPILPVLNIVPFFPYPMVGERYLYLSSAGVCIIAGMLLCKCPSRIRIWVFITMLTLFAATILERSSDYKSNLKFWEKAVASSPNSFKAHNSLGLAYFHKGDFKKAEEHYRIATEIFPYYAEAWVNMGTLYGFQKKFKQAEEFYEKAKEINPFLEKIYSALGVLYIEQDKLKEAEELFKKAVEMDDTLLGGYYYLGRIYEKEGKLKEAVSMYEKIGQWTTGDAKELNNLGFLTGMLGEYDKSIKYFQRAMKTDPNYLDPVVNLGNTYFTIGKYDKARECYLSALKMAPDSVAIKSNLEKIELKMENEHRIAPAE